jgi:hypothetical protein
MSQASEKFVYGAPMGEVGKELINAGLEIGMFALMGRMAPVGPKGGGAGFGVGVTRKAGMGGVMPGATRGLNPLFTRIDAMSGNGSVEGMMGILASSKHWAGQRVYGALQRGILKADVLSDYLFAMRYLNKGGALARLECTAAFEVDGVICVRSRLGNLHGASAMIHEGIHSIGIRGRWSRGIAAEVRSWAAQGYFEMSMGIQGTARRLIETGGLQGVRRHVQSTYRHLIP